MSAPAGQLPDHGTATPPWPRLPATFIAAAAVLVVVAAASGWFGRSVTASDPVVAAAPRVIDLGAVAVSAPGTWAPAGGDVAGLPRLGTDAVAFAPEPGLSARAVLTLAPFDDASLVPLPLQPLAGTAAPRRTTLAGLPAWAYRPRQLAKGQMAQVTVAPTTAGSLTAVCIAPAGTWSAAEGCAGNLAGASLEGATPLVPSASLAFRRRLAPVLDRFNGRRHELRSRLGAAKTRRGQARFATRLARVHLRARAALAPQAGAAGAPRRIVRELRRTARSYGRLAVAARNRWPGRYRQARLAIRRSDRALAKAVASVR